MLIIKKILLPVDFPLASLDVIHQAATLAQHFHADIVMLHVVSALSHAAGVPENSDELSHWDLLARVIREAQRQQDQSLGSELDRLTIRCVIAKGDPGRAIVQVSEEEEADLIMMPSYGYMFYQFLESSVIAKPSRRNACPVWTGAHAEESSGQKFAIRNVLCAVDLGPRTEEVLSWAVPMATEFGARLTVAHITADVVMWGPGGSCVAQEWKRALVVDVAERIGKLLHDTGVKADVFIDSGKVPELLSQAAKQTQADLLVTGCYPYGGHLRTHGYGIICSVPIPILNV
jgi:nucleotide-binding universal stress UspA family protein